MIVRRAELKCMRRGMIVRRDRGIVPTYSCSCRPDCSDIPQQQQCPPSARRSDTRSTVMDDEQRAFLRANGEQQLRQELQQLPSHCHLRCHCVVTAAALARTLAHCCLPGSHPLTGTARPRMGAARGLFTNQDTSSSRTRSARRLWTISTPDLTASYCGRSIPQCTLYAHHAAMAVMRANVPRASPQLD